MHSSTDFLNYPKGITFKDTHIRGKKRRSEGDYRFPGGPVVKTLHRTYVHTHTHTHTHTQKEQVEDGEGTYLQIMYKGISRFYSVSGGNMAAENDLAILRYGWLCNEEYKDTYGILSPIFLFNSTIGYKLWKGNYFRVKLQHFLKVVTLYCEASQFHLSG